MMVKQATMPARDNDNSSSASASAPPGTMGAGSGPWGGGKALIHPQRHNLKNRFELLRTLGEGTYGKVKLACEKASGEQVAIKYVKKTKIRDEMDLNRIRREIRILSSLRHPHIVNIRQVFEKKDRIVLVMDCALGGELYDHLNTHRHIPEPHTRRLFRQIVSAVHYMHQNSIVHRDIKLENIILDCEGNVKIADFGLANYFSYGHTLNTFCGSPLYASPEIVNGKPYHGPEVDVWSLGVVLYILSYGAMPFDSSNLKVLRQQITDGQYAEPAQPGGAAGLIRHMLTVTPSRRATMGHILDHWWVNLGHPQTPDGRQYQPLPFPTTRPSSTSSLHRWQACLSLSSDRELDLVPGQRQQPRRSLSADCEVDSRTERPPPGLNRVPGARSGRKVSRTTTQDGPQGSYEPQGISPTSSEGTNGVEEANSTASTDSGWLVSASPVPVADANANIHPEGVLNSPLVYGEVPAKLDNADHVVDNCSRCEGSQRLDNGQLQARNREEASSACGDLKTGSLDNLRTVSVFDSDRKPKRSILKRKGKFSGGDNGCCVAGEDGAYRLGASDSGSNTSLTSLPSASNPLPFSLPANPLPSSSPANLLPSSLPANPLPSSLPSTPLPSMSSVVTQPFSQTSVSTDLTPSTVSAKTTAPGCPGAAAAATSSHLRCPVHRGCAPITSSSSSSPADPASNDGSAVCGSDMARYSANPSTHHGSVTGSAAPNSESRTGEGSCYVPCASSTTTDSQGVCVSNNPPPQEAVCTCPVDMDVSKVTPRRKGILKNSANRNSLLDDTRKRLSLGSLSSNSSVDFLDLSYDSGDGEVFVARGRSSSSSSSSVGGQGQTLSTEPGDRHSFCLDGEFTALSLEGVAAGWVYPGGPCEQESIMDYTEAKEVVQQAFALIHNNNNNSQH